MQIRKFLAALSISISLILAGCTSNTSNITLDDTGWVLSSLNGQPTLPDVQVTINFENGTVHGTDGCNSYSTTYQVKDSKFSIDKNIITTLMACPEPIMQQASTYLAALMQAASYKIDGGQLTLLATDGKTLAAFTK